LVDYIFVNFLLPDPNIDTYVMTIDNELIILVDKAARKIVELLC